MGLNHQLCAEAASRFTDIEPALTWIFDQQDKMSAFPSYTSPALHSSPGNSSGNKAVVLYNGTGNPQNSSSTLPPAPIVINDGPDDDLNKALALSSQMNQDEEMSRAIEMSLKMNSAGHNGGGGGRGPGGSGVSMPRNEDSANPFERRRLGDT